MSSNVGEANLEFGVSADFAVSTSSTTVGLPLPALLQPDMTMKSSSGGSSLHFSDDDDEDEEDIEFTVGPPPLQQQYRGPTHSRLLALERIAEENDFSSVESFSLGNGKDDDDADGGGKRRNYPEPPPLGPFAAPPSAMSMPDIDVQSNSTATNRTTASNEDNTSHCVRSEGNPLFPSGLASSEGAGDPPPPPIVKNNKQQAATKPAPPPKAAGQRSGRQGPSPPTQATTKSTGKAPMKR